MTKISDRIDIQSSNNKISNMANAMSGLIAQMDSVPREHDGLFGYKIIINTDVINISSESLDVEFVVPFDDDMEANEAEIVIYNLSQDTISQFKRDDKITITAGYTDDVGIIFEGRISKIKTKRMNTDKQTLIYAIDCQSLGERNIENIAYKKGTSASYILKDLIGKSNMPLESFEIKRDHVFTDDVTIDGGLMDNIKKYSQICGVSSYINKGKVYVRHIKDGDNLSFIVSAETGLIGCPEEFEEEISSEDYKDAITGYNITMLLQHRITTGSIIDLDAEYAKGNFRVRSGSHSFNGTDFITEMSVI